MSIIAYLYFCIGKLTLWPACGHDIFCGRFLLSTTMSQHLSHMRNRFDNSVKCHASNKFFAEYLAFPEGPGVDKN